MHYQKFQLYIDKVTDFSSQYGSEIGSAYKIYKLIENPAIYPKYGDYSDAAVFRTYGKFWKTCPSHLKEVIPSKLSHYSSEDFFEFEINSHLVIDTIEIFETFNPGSVERIYFLLTHDWIMMWEKENQNGIKNVAKSQIFSPEIKQLPYPCNRIRVEINQTHNSYYSEFDAVKVTGYKADTDETLTIKDLTLSQSPMKYITLKQIPTNASIFSADTQITLSAKNDNDSNGEDYISFLPEEILIKIFSYFQLKTLSVVASVSRRFLASMHQALSDVPQLNLRAVWHKLDHASLVWLGTHCTSVNRVDLSWCGKHRNFTVFGICHFMVLVGANLTTLRLSACKFVNDIVIRCLAKNCHHLEELDLSSCVNATADSFSDLQQLVNLRYVNLYRTAISTTMLQPALECWPHLLHINIGSCVNLVHWPVLVATLGTHCRQLRSIDLWRSDIDSASLMRLVSECIQLEELDLGWCLKISSESGCFRTIAFHLGSKLHKLFLTSNRSVTDRDLEVLAERCPKLEQLDLLGARHVSPEAVLRLLRQCSCLRMLDLSFCCRIERRQVRTWATHFPHCAILVSYQDQLYSANM